MQSVPEGELQLRLEVDFVPRQTTLDFELSDLVYLILPIPSHRLGASCYNTNQKPTLCLD